ncbi:hypothetical protein F4777DRAFT_590326 [Nemania sp. FL0916]|nr:hypothetical protein F4777DRAFT_590326 [Nemania sp. FL0916]
MTHTHPFARLPFEQSDQLNRDCVANLAVRHGIQNTVDAWSGCFARDLESEILDNIYPHLWLVARKSGAHIDSLHERLVKRRAIVSSENPGLHLVRFYDTIYIKPLPDYLLNYTIWQDYISKPPLELVQARLRYDEYRSALGFLRSYSFLIRHESDFIIAQKANLLPKYVSFERFQRYIRPFRLLRDDEVSERYHHGQFRLTRLNWAVRVISIINIICPGHKKQQLLWNYHKRFWQTSEYLQHYAAPLIFIFALLTLILSSLQVIFAALGSNTWPLFIQVSCGFSIAVIIFSVMPVVGVCIGVSVLLLSQGQFALRMRRKELHNGNDSMV